MKEDFIGNNTDRISDPPMSFWSKNKEGPRDGGLPVECTINYSE
jgi:hypothetical protein